MSLSRTLDFKPFIAAIAAITLFYLVIFVGAGAKIAPDLSDLVNTQISGETARN